MAGSVNKVILVGNLGKDPEARSFANGGEVVNFTLATSESWTKDGQRNEKTEWHNVAVFNENHARFAKQYLRKGAKVYVEGQLQTRKWQDQNGNDRYSTEIVLQRFRGELVSLDKRSDSEGGSGGRSDDWSSGGGSGGGQRSSGGGSSGGGRSGPPTGGGSPFGDDLDDDVPF